MSADVLETKALADDVAELRSRFTNTQDLYREVCALLFFRYDTTPSTTKLYQLVRKGSMSAPAEALTRFWTDLREKSRVRVEHPEIPPALTESTADLVAALWREANSSAKEHLDIFRVEAAQEVQAATQKVAEASLAQSQAEQARDAALEELRQARFAIEKLQGELKSERQKRTDGETQIRTLLEDQVALRRVMEESMRVAADDLKAAREEARLAETRFRATEDRALVEIDRERQIAAKWQKELERVKTTLSADVESKTTQLLEISQREAGLSQRIGQLEGIVQASAQHATTLETRLETETKSAQGLATTLAAANRELELAREQIKQGEKRTAPARSKKRGAAAESNEKSGRPGPSDEE